VATSEFPTNERDFVRDSVTERASQRFRHQSSQSSVVVEANDRKRICAAHI
jgi:hypothetical protein